MKHTTARFKVYKCSNTDPYPRIRGVMLQKAHRAAPVILQTSRQAERTQKSDQAVVGTVNVRYWYRITTLYPGRR